MSIIRTWLVRHAAVDNEGKLYGVLDVPCLPIEREDVLHLQSSLPSPSRARYFTSGLVRTHETLKSVSDDAWQQSYQAEELNEQDLGSLEGQTFEELSKGANLDWNNLLADYDRYRPPKGESFVDVTERVGRFMENEMVKAEHGREHEDLVFFVHAGVVRAAIIHFLSLPFGVAMSFDVSYLSLTVLEHNRYQDDTPKLWSSRISCSNWRGEIV